MKIINPNNEILNFIKGRITTQSFPLFNVTKETYSLDKDLETLAKIDASMVLLLIECENKFNINIKDKDAWKVKTPLDLYNLIQKELEKKKK